MKEEQECVCEKNLAQNKHLKRYRQKKIKTFFFVYGWEKNGKLLLMLCMCSHHNTVLIIYFFFVEFYYGIIGSFMGVEKIR